MADSYSLDPTTLALLAPHPRRQQLASLLAGGLGPLQGCGFPEPIADLAIVAYLLYGRARKEGVVAKMMGYEARDAAIARLRGAWRRADTWADVAVAFAAELRVSVTDLRPEDLVWWRARANDADRLDAYRLHRREDVEQALALLISEGWDHQLYRYAEESGAVPAEPVHESDPELPPEAA